MDPAFKGFRLPSLCGLEDQGVDTDSFHALRRDVCDTLTRLKLELMRVTLLVTLLLEPRKKPMADFKVTVTIQILTKLQSLLP